MAADAEAVSERGFLVISTDGSYYFFATREKAIEAAKLVGATLLYRAHLDVMPKVTGYRVSFTRYTYKKQGKAAAVIARAKDKVQKGYAYPSGTYVWTADKTETENNTFPTMQEVMKYLEGKKVSDAMLAKVLESGGMYEQVDPQVRGVAADSKNPRNPGFTEVYVRAQVDTGRVGGERAYEAIAPETFHGDPLFDGPDYPDDDLFDAGY